MAKIETITNINGETVYPRTIATAVRYDDNRSMLALAVNGVYMKESDGVAVDAGAPAALTGDGTGIDAEWLEGHSASYFATASEVAALRQLVESQAEKIAQLEAQLAST